MIVLPFDAMNTAQTTRQQELQNRVKQSIDDVGYAQLKSITCEVDGESVTLRGQLDSFYLKQVAQSVVGKIPGVGRIRNRITIG